MRRLTYSSGLGIYRIGFQIRGEQPFDSRPIDAMHPISFCEDLPKGYIEGGLGVFRLRSHFTHTSENDDSVTR